MCNLTECRTCKHKIWTYAKSCPNCGCPIWQKQTECRTCKLQIAPDAKSCPRCGVYTPTKCRTCKHQIAPDAESCPNCGCPKPTTEQYNRRFMQGYEKHWSGVEKALMWIAIAIVFVLLFSGQMESCAPYG